MDLVDGEHPHQVVLCCGVLRDAFADSLALGFILSLLGSILLFVGLTGSFAGACLSNLLLYTVLTLLVLV